MSKKKNRKFKKSSSAPKTAIPVSKNAASSQDNAQEITPEVTGETENLQAEEVKDELELLNEKYLPIRRDVKKLLVVLASLAVIFVLIYFIGIKTTILDKAGDWLYEISNIQTQ